MLRYYPPFIAYGDSCGFCFVYYREYFQGIYCIDGWYCYYLVCMMMLSRWLKKQSIFMERTFIQNLRFRDMHAEFTGQKRPEYEGHLLSRDIHLSDFEVPADSLWAGHTLKELNLGYKYGVHVASIIRGMHRINIPGANVRCFPAIQFRLSVRMSSWGNLPVRWSESLLLLKKRILRSVR